MTTTTIDDALAEFHDDLPYVLTAALYENVTPDQYNSIIQFLFDGSLNVSLRAQPGKMKPEDAFAVETALEDYLGLARRSDITGDDDVKDAKQAIDAFKRIKADALAAAQPELRPLRELIAEGCEHFWMKLGRANYLCMIGNGSLYGRDGVLTIHFRIADCLDCPAIPIPKPTVTPLPEDRSRFPSDRDWPEDFSGENGNYTCRCVRCRETFKGYKRRVVCKLCDTTAAAKGKL